MADILVTEEISGDELNALRNTFEVVVAPDLCLAPEKLITAIGPYRGLIVRNQTRVTASLIQAGTALRVIGRAGVGLDNIDVHAASEAGVVVVYTPDQNAISVAEMTLALLLNLGRRICPADGSTKSGQWQRHHFAGVELYGKTLGVIGLGRIGFLVGMRARALGMDIVAHDPWISPDAATVCELRARMVTLDKLAQVADFVSCHLPATEQTESCIDYQWLSGMKPSAYFVNTSRGQVVDEEGLIRALMERKIAGAALDVRRREPPVKDALSQMKNVILTPHIAAFTHEAQARVTAAVCQDVTAVLQGKPATHYANFARAD